MVCLMCVWQVVGGRAKEQQKQLQLQRAAQAGMVGVGGQLINGRRSCHAAENKKAGHGDRASKQENGNPGIESRRRQTQAFSKTPTRGHFQEIHILKKERKEILDCSPLLLEREGEVPQSPS